MPKYIPIEVNPPIKAHDTNLLQFRWVKDAITADFIIPEDAQIALRVQFHRVEIVRLIEEMPISTENEETANEGIISNHFAYLVQGASFWNHQSETFKAVYTTAKHYRFFTGWTCLDVIASRGPSFAVVPMSAL